MNTVKKSFSILESFKQNRTRISPSKRVLNKRSRNSKDINIQQTVFTKSKIQQGYREYNTCLYLRDIVNRRSRNSKDINIQQIVFTESKIQQGYGENKLNEKIQYIVYIYVRFAQPNFRNFYFLFLRIFFISSAYM